MDNRNQLSSASRSGTFTVAGATSQERGSAGSGYGATNVTVSGTGLSSGAAELYADGSWARAGATLASGANSYTATASDWWGRTAQDTVSVNLPATPSYTYDGNGNLTGDGTRSFEYDFENQLTNVYVSGQWRSEFGYDAMGRRRVRREYGWSGGAWVKTNEVRYVYDGRLVLQERDENNLALVTYTRGKDLSGSFEGAGGIGGLLARTDNRAVGVDAHAFYHFDGNGNVVCMINASNVIVAHYTYDPFGRVLAKSGPLADANLYRFSTKEYHPNSGLVYYLYRYYEPSLQRWVNRDPLNELGGANLYRGLRNNPLSWHDPFGLKDGKEGDEPNSIEETLCEFAEKIEKYADIVKEWLKTKMGRVVGRRGPSPGSTAAGAAGAVGGVVVQAGTKALEAGPGTTEIGILQEKKCR